MEHVPAPLALLTVLATARARLFVTDEAELLLSRDPVEWDVWRIAREADLVNTTEIPSDECPGI
jgi:hypothetical protein